jgi:uncharacterized membrane protein
VSRWTWLLVRLARRLWLRAALFSLLGVVTALLAAVAEPFIPYEITLRIGAAAVDNILGILASSMLAVTTFSLSTMVSAFAAATSNASPRATRLLLEDSTAQNAISSFLGSFLFSIVGIVALSTGIYGENGRVILFGATVLVILWISVTLLRWIEHLSRLGRVDETTQRIADAAAAAMAAWRTAPRLGAAAPIDRPATAHGLTADRIGHVQHIDLAALQALAAEMETELHLCVLPGAHVHPWREIAWLDRAPSSPQAARLREAFSIGETRSFDQDPRYGLVVLAEIASRALSPAVNDPGTAISVLAAGGKLFVGWAEAQQAAPPEIRFPLLHAPALDAAALFDDFFRPLRRDGAAMVEVGIRLQKTLTMLAACAGGVLAPQARRHAALALEAAEAALTLPDDRAALRRAAQLV